MIGIFRTTEKPTANSTFAIGGVSHSADSFVVAESFVLCINICTKNPAHRKSAKRWDAILRSCIPQHTTDRLTKSLIFHSTNEERELRQAARSLCIIN
jgi:hypothetical protein